MREPTHLKPHQLLDHYGERNNQNSIKGLALQVDNNVAVAVCASKNELVQPSQQQSSIFTSSPHTQTATDRTLAIGLN
jgi:hypothetical protein